MTHSLRSHISSFQPHSTGQGSHKGTIMFKERRHRPSHWTGTLIMSHDKDSLWDGRVVIVIFGKFNQSLIGWGFGGLGERSEYFASGTDMNCCSQWSTLWLQFPPLSHANNTSLQDFQASSHQTLRPMQTRRSHHLHSGLVWSLGYSPLRTVPLNLKKWMNYFSPFSIDNDGTGKR